MSSEDVRFAAKELAEKYSVDVTDDLVGELEHLKAIHAANMGDAALSPLDMMNSLHTSKLDVIFHNIIVILRIFCTLPVTVAQAERSFSTLARVTRSSADADNRLDAFSGQSRSTNMVPFHMLHIFSYCAIATLSLRQKQLGT